jgi:hypothetical protein
LIGLFLLAAAVTGPVQAEYAFARDAQRIGQWSAFRKWADHDAVMFTPQAVWARQFLMDRKDPKASIRWRPTKAFLSCDGRTGVDTGPWVLPSGKLAGRFTTVWQRTGGRWKWVYDGGGPASGGGREQAAPKVRRASCSARAPGAPIIPPPPLSPKQARRTPEDSGRGESADKTLGWDWKVDSSGERHFRLYQWNGTRYALVLNEDVPPR